MAQTQHIDTNAIVSDLRNNRPHILIVEDERLVCWSLEQALIKAGYNVTAVLDGNEAINKLQCCQYDMVITDFDLPGVNGDLIALQARKGNNDMSVILTGAFSEYDTKLKGKQGYFDLFLEKPYNLKETIEQVSSLLCMKSAEND